MAQVHLVTILRRRLEQPPDLFASRLRLHFTGRAQDRSEWPNEVCNPALTSLLLHYPAYCWDQ